MRTRITTVTPAAALTGIWGLLLLASVIAGTVFRADGACANRPGYADHLSPFAFGDSPGALDRTYRRCFSHGDCNVRHLRSGELGHRASSHRSR